MGIRDEQEGSGSNISVASSSLINWWDVHATSNSSSLSNNFWIQPNPNPHDHSHNSSTSNCDDDLSVSNNSTSFTTNHSSHHHHHQNLWTHLLLGGGSNEEMQNREEVGVGENFVDALSSKSILFDEEPACDYLNKMDNTTTWDQDQYNNNNTFDDKHYLNINGGGDQFSHEANHHHHMLHQTDHQRLSNKLSNLLTTWSIAPPHPQPHHNSHFLPQTNNIPTLNHSSILLDHSTNFPTYGSGSDGALDHMKVKQERHQHLLHDASDQFGIGRDSCSNNFGYHQNGSSVMGDKINGKFYYGMPSAGLSSCTRNLTDVISFAGRLGRPVIGIHALKPTFKSSRLRTNSNGRGQGSCTEVKKKRTEESSEVMLKKPKQDQTSTASSTKVQAPKVKLSDRITTLQQIVSPFGKTDTASVLFEAIGCIKFLQEQIQLLSNSYMKTNSHKDGWGSLDRKEKDVKVDLRSRGLCLVPISFTPQLYTDNTAPDYWTPPYRGCFYR